MGLQCCAASCSTSQKTAAYKAGSTRLHRVPKDLARRRQWAIAIRRKNEDGGLWIPWLGAVLCSLHFPEKDMDRTGQTVRLREGVTPSLFNYSETGSQGALKRGAKRLLSLKELDKILEGFQQHDTTENSPPMAPSQPSQPLPSEGDSPRRVTRQSIRVRRMSTNCSLMPPKTSKGKYREARVPHCIFSEATRKSVQLEHPYHQPRPDSRLSSDADDPGETGGMSSPEPSQSSPPSPPPPSPPSSPPPSLPPSPPLTVPQPLQLPSGQLTRYLTGIKNKQHRLHYLQKTYHSLLDKVQFRNSHPDWWSEKKADSALETPLLTLRHEWSERDPPLVPIATLSEDTLLPLTPNEAWKAVSALREQVLDLQLALMNSRIQALDGELRLLELKAIHKRYQVDVKEERKQTQQSQRATVREVEKRAHEPCPECPKLRRKLAIVERVANKRVRRAEALSKRLEKVFTPMQMRVLRTGKKGRWLEEDIRRAIKLKLYVSHRGYSYIRQRMGIPLPSAFVLTRGVERYESLQPLYNEMLAENKKKVRKPKAGKDGSSMAAKKRMMDEVPEITSLEPVTVERPLVKRRKKRPLAQLPPPRQPHGYEVEFASYDHGTPADGAEAYVPPTSSHHSRAAGRGGRTGILQPGVSRARAWKMNDEESIDEETLEQMTRPREMRDSRSWSSGRVTS